MNFRFALLVAASCLMAMAADGGEFRRIESLGAEGDGGRLVLEDWDGDGALELLRGDMVDENGTGRVGRYAALTQIYENDNGSWAAWYGFIHRFQQLYGAKTDRIKRDEIQNTIYGDFNGDGLEDLLVAEPRSATATGGDAAEFVLRLKQAGDVLYEDPLDGVYAGPDDNFSRFELLDIDGDGTKEVLVWILSYRENDRLMIYGNEQSKWRGNPSYDVPNQLNDALLYLKGIRAARPEPPCPVKVTMEVLKDDVYPSFSHPKLPDANRFKLTFKDRNDQGEVDLGAWRDYFQKWAMAYTRETGNPNSTRSSWGLHLETVDDALLVAIGARETKEGKPTGWHAFWLECAFVGADSKPFNWMGTLRTEKAMVSLVNDAEGEGGAK